jgi:hypothetical protein
MANFFILSRLRFFRDLIAHGQGLGRLEGSGLLVISPIPRPLLPVAQ